MPPRKKIGLFLSLTAVFSLLCYVPMLQAGTAMAGGGLLILALMWSPAAAAMLTQLIATRSLRGLGWRFGSIRWLALAYILPVLYGLPVYAFAWLTGLATILNPYTFSPSARQFASPDMASAMPVFLLANATWGFLMPNLLLALGEEIGWRGLLVPELARITGFTRTAVVSGAIWAAWHLPAVLFLDYAAGKTPRWFETLCFTIMIIGLSFAFAWLRLKSGSLWPAAVLHASHNLFIQGVYDGLTGPTGLSPYLTGEFGLGLALMGLVVAYIFWRARASIERTDVAAIPAATGRAVPADPG